MDPHGSIFHPARSVEKVVIGLKILREIISMREQPEDVPANN